MAVTEVCSPIGVRSNQEFNLKPLMVGRELMLRKFLSFVSLVLLGHLMICVQPAYANSKAEEQLRFAEKVKASIAKLGVGQEARVTVTLKDKTKIAGYVSEAKEDHFVITDSGTGTSTSVTYSSVSQASGRNLSTGAKIAIAIGLIVLIVIIPILLLPKT
jgi:preprotein translocase subunit SecF